MTERLLNILDYPETSNLNFNDETTFRTIIVWLEQNRIKKANQNTLNTLKNINNNKWDESFTKYLDQIGCPKLDNKLESLRWLLGLAIQVKTAQERDLYINYAVENLKSTNVPNVVAENPLDKLDFQSPEFVEGINSIAKILKITPHPNHLITLKAISRIVTERLSTSALEHPEEFIIKGTPYPYQDADLGFELKDPVLNRAAKLLRILYIHDLRDLQTKANELIVAAQGVTANPKTDTKLGKVGK